MLRSISRPTDEAGFKAQKEYSRVLSAAVINKRFRDALLANPVNAVTRGYSGERFDLTTDQQQRLSSIQSGSLQDFAAQLA